MVSVEKAHSKPIAVGLGRQRRTVLPRLSGRHLQLGLLIAAAALLIGSIVLPYWTITLRAPQYPKGLQVTAYVSRLTGEVREVDELNHYIGMMKLNTAAQVERSISRFALPAVALLALTSFWVRGRLKWLVILPLVMYPVIFVADLAVWLYYAGHSLDPTAPLSSAIKPFTPRVFGVGKIGQFATAARFGVGFYLALLSAGLALAATYLARRGRHAPR